MSGKCLKCDRLVTRVKIDAINGSIDRAAYKCISFLCPWCSAVLGVQIDPVAVKADTIDGLMQALRKK